MNSIARWKIILSLVGIFVAGAIAGGVVTVSVVQRQVRQRNNPERWADVTLMRWNQRLGLTSEQREKLRPILEQTAREMRELRARDIRDTDAMIGRAQERLEPILDSAQREKLRHMQEARRRHLQRWFGSPEPRRD